MRQKKRNVTIVLLILFMMNGVFTTRKVQAASASIVMAVLSENVQVGDTFSVSVTLTSTATIGEVSQVVAYDTEILRFITETSVYEENDGAIAIEDQNASASSQKYILQFKAVKEGTAKIEISGTPKIYSTNGSILSFSKNKLSVPVSAKKEKSANRNLSSISIKEGKLDAEFKKVQTEYTMSVGQEVKSLTITAVPESAGSKVTVSGADKLLVGQNTVTIKVTSETGKSKEYSILVTRGTQAPVSENEAAQQSMEPGVTLEPGTESKDKEESKTEDGKKKLSVEDGILQVSAAEQYELLTLEQLRTLPKGYLSVNLLIDGQAVDAYQLEDGKDKEMYLIYAKRGEGAPGFYVYDSREETVQRYVENTLQTTPALVGVSIEDYNKKVRKLSMIIGVCGGLMVLFAMAAFHYYKRSKEIGERF